jgi:MFS family permease
MSDAARSAAVTDRGRPRGGLLRHRNFRLLWAGQSVSDLGTAVSGIVLPLIAVVYLDASALEVGLLSALVWLPWLLIGLPAGVLVDRSRKRPLLIWCDVARAVLMGSVPIAAAFDALTIGQLFVVAAAVGFATVFFQVAYQSYLPTLIARDELTEGNAKLQGSQAAAGVIGPGVGGLLVEVFRAPFALIADALSYLVSVVALLGITAREAEPERPERRSLRAEIAEGARFVRADPLLRVMTISPALGNFFYIGYEAIVVLFLVRTVHLRPGLVGVLLALVGVGAVIGAALARPFARWVGTARALWLGFAITAPFSLLIPLTTGGFGVLLFVFGNVIMLMGVLVYNVTIGSFRQAYCPPNLLGRIVATMRFVLFGSMPLGALFGGVLADLLGTRSAVLVLMLGNLIPVLVLVTSPLRTMRDLPERPPEALSSAGSSPA